MSWYTYEREANRKRVEIFVLHRYKADHTTDILLIKKHSKALVWGFFRRAI